MATIVTFYSYKGGTGRSMALANVAWILASGGQRVLVVDWDLEAPGLHHYFRPFLPDADLLAMDVRGVIDFVFEYVAIAATPPQQIDADRPAVRPKDWYKPYADIRQCAIPLCWPSGDQVRFGERGGIDFVPAGRQEPGIYAARVNGFNWPHFYEHQSGGAFMDAVRDSMQTYDYVLIDSRTGVSDTAGICTVQMPDMLVLCFTLNNQSIRGASGVAVQLAAALKDKPVLPVPMRVDPFEKDKLNRRREYAHRVFAKLVDAQSRRFNVDPSRYWSDVEIPYFASYAYEELLAPFEKFSSSLGSMLPALEKLTGYISGDKGRRFSADISEVRRAAVAAAYEQTGSAPLEPAGAAAQASPHRSGDDSLTTTAANQSKFDRRRLVVVASLVVGVMIAAATWFQMMGRTGKPIEPQAVAAAPSAQVEAFNLRIAGNVDGAIAALTHALDQEQSSALRAPLFLDRAYCQKLQGKWAFSIDDLSQALTIGATSDRAISTLSDRAFAYLKVMDPEAALRDYEAVLSLTPVNASRESNSLKAAAQATATLLREMLKPTQPGSLFVFVPVGRVNGPAKMSPAVKQLGKYINLRFWWHPIVDQVRFTEAADESLASDYADRLRKAGFILKAPVITRALVTHDRRIEVWVNERLE